MRDDEVEEDGADDNGGLPGDYDPPALIPEFLVTDLGESLAFWRDILGFEVVYDRPDEGFVFLRRESVHVMLEELSQDSWETGPMERPFGRGINVEMSCSSLRPLLANLADIGWPLFRQPQERWYRARSIEIGVRQFLVQDPDGYLLRFQQDIGHRQADAAD